MMRSFALALLAVLVLVPAGLAQPKVRIDDNGVRVGFPSGEASGFKIGAWAPVYIQLTAGVNRVGRADGVILVETTDCDDLQNTFRVDLPPMEPHEQTQVLAYVRPGTAGSEVVVSIHGADGRQLSTQKAVRGGYAAYPPGAFLYLTAGAQASGLRRALRPPKAGQNAEQEDAADDNDKQNAFAFVTEVSQLPTRWFGYGSVDAVLLNTGSRTFVQSLLDDQSNRKEALAEWVRRGGRLAVSVGRENQLVKALLDKMQLLGVTLDGTVQRKALTGVSRWAGAEGEPLQGPPRKDQPGERANLDLVKLDVDPRRGVEVLAWEPVDERDPVERPSVIEAPCGLGQVVLVAFDVDLPPFTGWTGQARFWQKLNTEVRPNYGREAQVGQPFGMKNNFNYDNVDRNDAVSVLQDRLESFDEVPVISFGWVALFILLYIVVVGPLDYFFLKRVVKRLELTWITFPAVVLVVSALAYFSAYYLKGNDLRINKVDVVDLVADFDADGARSHASHAYGTTWFTLFSPRIQNYTVGVEPAPDVWVPAVRDKETSRNPHGVVVSWMGRPENTWGGAPAGSPSLFRRSYEYAPDASGLQGVPVQVWSTKSFAAGWQAGLSPDRSLVVADLRREDKGGLKGSITSNLPVRLEEVSLFYQDKRYKLDDLVPGATVTLAGKNIGTLGGIDADIQIDSWFNDVPTSITQPQWGGGPTRYHASGQQFSARGLIKELLFGERDTSSAVHSHNNTLHSLDETWRLKRHDEVIVYGRVAPQSGPAEVVTQDGVSPSRLWLGKLPGPGETRPALAGKLSQETYVRVFLPVATKRKAEP